MSPKKNQPPEGVLYRSKVWRYMSVPKFISMLSTQSVYFCRVDMLDDHLEAMLSKKTLETYVSALLENEQVQATLTGREVDGDEIAHLVMGTNDMMLRAKTFVNCWYLNEIESVAMWQTYGREGVAIQSTWKRLTEAFSDDVGISQIRYVDYTTEIVNPRVPFLYKDRIFEGERKIRLMVRNCPRESSIVGFNRDHPVGVDISVNLDRLIKRVYVAPKSRKWFTGVIEELLRKYGLEHKLVTTSGADHRPRYRQLFEDARTELFLREYPLTPYEDEYSDDDPWGLLAENQRT